MGRTTQEGTVYDYDKIEDATLNGVSRATAAKIAGELKTTSIESVEDTDDGEYRVEITTDGGFTAFGAGTANYAIKAVIGQANPETITVRIVEKRV